MNKDAYLFKKDGTEIDAKIQDLMSDAETDGNAELIFTRPKKSEFATKTAQILKTKSWNLKLQCNSMPSIGIRSIISKLKEPFDAEAVAKKVVNNQNSKYFGMDWQKVVEMWSNKGATAGAKGTGIDVYAAHLFDYVPIDMSSWSTEMQAACKQFDKLKQELLDTIGAELVVREQWIQDTNNIKGRIDALFNIQNKLMLVDWKSNGDIPRTNSFGTKMIGPCEMLDDCKANEFTLQLYMYKYFIETYFGLQIASCRIGWIRPQGYEMMKPNFPYNADFIKSCIEYGFAHSNLK